MLSNGSSWYIYGAGITPIAQTNGAAVSYFGADNVGSVRTLTSSSGGDLSAIDYDPFGNVTNQSGTLTSQVGFSGAWTDADSELVYLRARDYDPRASQFVQVDPLLTATRSTYAYVDNNPLSRVDPTGMDQCASGYQDYVFMTQCQLIRSQADYAVYVAMQQRNAARQECLLALVIANARAQMDPWQLALYDQWSGYSSSYESVFGGIDTIISSYLAGGGGFRVAIVAGKTTLVGRPNFVVDSNRRITIVPTGASGPHPTRNGVGAYYVGGQGGRGLHDSVQNVRVLPPNSRSGGVDYPKGMSQYTKTLRDGEQIVHPHTGKPIGQSDLHAHWIG